jgi:hypothetical protein
LNNLVFLLISCQKLELSVWDVKKQFLGQTIVELPPLTEMWQFDKGFKLKPRGKTGKMDPQISGHVHLKASYKPNPSIQFTPRSEVASTTSQSEASPMNSHRSSSHRSTPRSDRQLEMKEEMQFQQELPEEPLQQQPTHRETEQVLVLGSRNLPWLLAAGGSNRKGRI